MPELPDRDFPGKMTRISEALQSGARTLLTEIDFANPDGALSAGVYCTVELQIPRKTPSLSVPAEALIFNRSGMQVGVVNNGKAELRKVKVKRDLGTRVEVDSGIRAGDQMILNPPITLIDGSKVQARPDAPTRRARRLIAEFLGDLSSRKEANMLLHPANRNPGNAFTRCRFRNRAEVRYCQRAPVRGRVERRIRPLFAGRRCCPSRPATGLGAVCRCRQTELRRRDDRRSCELCRASDLSGNGARCQPGQQ